MSTAAVATSKELRDTAQFKALFSPALLELRRLFTALGHELRLAGGAVRDLLLGQTPADLDFATTATPAQMKAFFAAESVRLVNNNGEAHGTLTVRLLAENFEVTTLRVDCVTDGRHAEVEFTRNWQLDASRRDLTVNAMFLGLDGTLFDYFGGRADLAACRCRFVGEPAARITEDYLRILRYFRFFGRLAAPDAAHEQATLAAITDHAYGLETIAGERLWLELRKLLVGAQAPALMSVMTQCGVLARCGLPAKPELAELADVWRRSRGAATAPAANLAALLHDRAQLDVAHQRLKLSNLDLGLAGFLLEHREAAAAAQQAAGEDGLQRHLQELFLMRREMANMDMKTLELARYLGAQRCAETLGAWQGTAPRLPVNGRQLMAAWGVKGKQVGLVLGLLRERWRQRDFVATLEQLTSEAMRQEVMPEVARLLREQNADAAGPPASKMKLTA